MMCSCVLSLREEKTHSSATEVRSHFIRFIDHQKKTQSMPLTIWTEHRKAIRTRRLRRGTKTATLRINPLTNNLAFEMALTKQGAA